VQVFEDFRYTDEFDGVPGTLGHVLVFRARIGDRELEGVDILRTDDEGTPTELTVMVRPYSAATLLRERMAALLSG
jgi:hypothetical protein